MTRRRPAPRPGLRWTLRRRLVVLVLGLLAVVSAGTTTVSTLALQDSLVAQLDEQLEASSERAVGAERRFPPVPPDGDLEPLPQRPGDGPPRGLDALGQGAGTVTLAVRDGVVQSGRITRGGDIDDLTAEQETALAAVPADGGPRTVSLDGLGDLRVVATSLPDDDLVVTALPLAEAAATVQQYVVVQVLVLLAGLGLAAVAGGLLVRRELRPLERVAATATRVVGLPLHQGEVTLRERVPVADADAGTEVGQVGRALNQLLGHVEGALAARQDSETRVRQFVADASHELRTPLASIRGYTELVRRREHELPADAARSLQRVESESRRMTALVEDLLLLARLDAGRPLAAEEVDLTALVVDAVSDAHAAGPDHVWRLELPDVADDDVPDDDAAGDLDVIVPAVRGDEDRLRQVLANLLANARVHTPPGTTVTTSVQACPDGTVELRVTDDGPGIPPDLQPHLFDRFTRGDSARSPGAGSTGLGLAIVDAVVTAHGGQIAVSSSPAGTTFRVVLPAVVP